VNIINWKLGNALKYALVMCLKTLSHSSEDDEISKRLLESSFLAIIERTRKNYYPMRIIPNSLI
jgi:hypothetical protein